MKVIRKKPGCEPEVIDIDNTLAALQQEVGGYIETVTIASDAVVICNEVVTRTSSVTCRRPTF